jgi:pimeloyl-ACP methyl ester carboxylesterase
VTKPRTTAARFRTGAVVVRGCEITYHRMGHDRGPTAVLVHGGAAHSGWWRRAAPLLAERRQVVLVDLSGHGDSGHRPDYAPAVWAEEIAAVLGECASSPATVVGHSMGGLVAVATGARFPALVKGLVMVDTRLPLRGLPAPTAAPRLFPTADEALRSFRLLPRDTTAAPDVVQEIAEAGLCEADGGWRWKFDPKARRRFVNSAVIEDLAALSCPVSYVYGEHSDMGGQESLRFLEGALGRAVPWSTVPGAFHHVPLDQPRACAEAVDRLLVPMEQSLHQ